MKRASDLALSDDRIFQDRYKLLAKIGEGGFGTVYKAQQIATGQLVAIKVLELASAWSTTGADKRLARFRREMQLCAQLHHPNIVRLIDSGESAEGLVYTVFEFAPGKNLAEVLAGESALEPREARYLMLQVLDALACAHAAGVVHRDLKPANIMIIPTGARRNALVLDFGIGAITGDALRDDQAKITATNEALGTPAYAAPEQLRGRPATPRSDLYAWGLVFLECLTGQRVFVGETVMEVIFNQMSADAIPIPPLLMRHPVGRLLQRALIKDADARDVTAEGMLKALDACDLSGLPRYVAVGAHAALAAGPTVDDSTPPAQNQGAIVTETLQFSSAGSNTTPPLSQASEALSSPRLSEGERRQLTALCCNLMASSTIEEGVDVDDIDEVLRIQQEICVGVARRLGGHVAGVLGDQVLIYFGLPTAREDDAQRAARAALAISAECKGRGVGLEAQRRIASGVSIGIHTGFVTRELRDPSASSTGSIVGMTPKIATRLGALASPGTILVTGDTYRLLRNQFVFADAGARTLEATARPSEVYRLEDERRQRMPGAAGVPLIGRENELGILLQRWGQARAGTGQCVLITGEPGIGKSRLVLELTRKVAAEPHVALECRCSPDEQNSALRPVIDLLERLLEISRTSTSEERAKKLEAFLSEHAFDLDEGMPLFAELLSIPLPPAYAPLEIPPPKRKELTQSALISLFCEMAEQRPVLFFVEDLHWADPTTLELLTALVEEVPSARIFAAFSARPEFQSPWQSAKVLPIQLSRLDRKQVEQLAERITDGKALPIALVDQLVGRTDGVPLFVEELLRMIVESGALSERGDRYTVAAGAVNVAIPATLRDLLMARLDRVGPAKALAQTGAVLGREFAHELLCAVTSLDEAAVKDQIEHLVQADLVHRRRRLRGTIYVFKHALIRDTAYESMTKSARRDVHARVAATLEKQFPEIAAVQPELVGHHYADAGLYAQAAAYALRAGRRAAERSANREAEQHLADGLRWLEHVEPSGERARTELDLRSQLASVFQTTRGYGAPEVEQALEKLVPIIAELGDTPELFKIRWARWSFLLNRARNAEALRLAEENLEVARRSGDRAHLTAAHTALGGGSLYMTGRLPEALENLEIAAKLYDPEVFRPYIIDFGQDMGVTLHAQLALILSTSGYLARGLEVGEAGIALARRSQHAHSEQMSLALHMQHLQVRRDRAGITRTFAELTRLCQKESVPQWEAFGQIIAHWAEAPDDAEALERMRMYLGAFQASGAMILLSYWQGLFADACLSRGRIAEGLEHVMDGLAFVEQWGERVYVVELHRVRGELLAAQGANEEAEASFREGLDIARKQVNRIRELTTALSFARLLARLGRVEEAKRELGSICAWFDDAGGLAMLDEARALLAELG